MADNEATEPAGWQVYLGTGESRLGVKLPPPPPWRIYGGEAGGIGLRAKYRPYPRLVTAVNVAISLRRPLLLTGPAGFGKSSVADAIAHELGLGEPLRWSVTSQSTVEEALYRYDALGRLHHHQLNRPDDLARFVRLGPLGTALGASTLRVLLIDELDKGDIDVPGDLLNVLERGDFDIPVLARHDEPNMEIRVADSDSTVSIVRGHLSCHVFPIIVITSNGEREFPPAFLRRCIRERMEIPDDVRLAEIVQSHLGPELAEKAGALIKDFADRLNGNPPAALAIDQLLNSVLLMTRDDAPSDPEARAELLSLLEKELRDS
jgi:MoxR-like ATPase